MQLTMEEENDNKTIFWTSPSPKKTKTYHSVYRKPTTTHSIIPGGLFHPSEHKFAAVRHLTNRLTTYTMNNTDKEKRENTIKQILYNNKYDTSISNKFIPIYNKKTRKKKRKN